MNVQKEELRAGKGVKKALADGYSNAFSAIFDSNLTSIITGIILFNFGTGPIRGFATTLIIGILVSFFTAVFITRIVYEHFMNKRQVVEPDIHNQDFKESDDQYTFRFYGYKQKVPYYRQCNHRCLYRFICHPWFESEYRLHWWT